MIIVQGHLYTRKVVIDPPRTFPLRELLRGTEKHFRLLCHGRAGYIRHLN
ncbi:hypothetical protein AMD24_00098 [Candidatus Xiphinematobacter sp. Idaho Grape]|nr:hypothetical protein AMD24_00098 [Candidatus Xiphinematobacter sp. Idaho Grape]